MSSNCRMRIEALDAYLHGMLNETQQREITAHLLVCLACNKNLAALEAETYTIGKALRDIPTPAMSVPAADLVARYAEPRPAQAPSPYSASALESSRMMQPAAAGPGALASKSKVSQRVFRKVRQGAVAAWNHAQSRSLVKVAAVTFVGGMALWFAAATARRIESIDQSQYEQTNRFTSIERAQTEIRKMLERNTQENQRLIADLQNELEKNGIREKTLAQLQIMQEQEKLSSSIAELKNKIDKVGIQIGERNEDSARIKKDLDQRLSALLAQQAEVNGLAERLKKLTDKPVDGAPAVAAAPEPDEPGTIRLLANGENNVEWDEKDGTLLGALTDKGKPVGFTVSLSNLGGAPAPDDSGADARGALVDTPRFTGVAAFNGRIFVGNGSAENNLVAFDGATGGKLWSVRTRDSGGGQPVVSEDGRTVFFTENASVRAINVSNGSQNWVRNVGGAVLTQPAVDSHHVYVVHATGRNAPGMGDPKFPYSITCLHPDGGNVIWSRNLREDAISAPVIDNGKVFVATRDGEITVYDIHGTVLRNYQANATSAPTVASGGMFFSAWAPNGRSGFEESLCQLAVENSGRGIEHLTGAFPAPYFLSLPMNADAAESVGGNLENIKALTKTEQSIPALAGAWSYYGARPTIIEGTAYAVLGDHLVAWDMRQAKVTWSVKIVGNSDSPTRANQGQPPLTPPAYANGKLYLGSVWGDLLCVDAQTGAVRWRYRLPGAQSVTSQVVLDQGRAYTTTSKGLLVCVETGDPGANAWTMWGGSAGHNGPSSVKWIRRDRD